MVLNVKSTDISSTFRFFQTNVCSICFAVGLIIPGEFPLQFDSRLLNIRLLFTTSVPVSDCCDICLLFIIPVIVSDCCDICLLFIISVLASDYLISGYYLRFLYQYPVII
jgi:hypothetical protein